MHDDQASDEKWKQYITQITDPVEMLRVIVENQDFLGYDSYYSDLRKVLLQQAEKIVAARKGAISWKTGNHKCIVVKTQYNRDVGSNDKVISDEPTVHTPS